MTMSQKQELRQSQSLVMTPQLQQAIKLLQLSNLEITDFVDKEIEKNPLLELADPSRPERGDGSANEIPVVEKTENLDSASMSEKEQLPNQNEEPLDLNYSDFYDDSTPNENGGAVSQYTSSSPLGGQQGRLNSNGNSLEQMIGDTVSLTDHLIEQLHADIIDPVNRIIGFHLIHMLDSAGYFSGEIDTIAKQIGCEPQQVNHVLKMLKNFEPVGVFASDLRECLALQLKERDRLDPIMKKLLDNLDYLARHDQKALLKLCDVDEEDLIDMINEIRALNPKPGDHFNNDIAQSVVPDVFVKSTNDGGWSVELNSDTLPRVLVNRQYFALVKRSNSSENDKSYIYDQLHSANWLVKSLEQRAQTILKVATEIVRQQDGFLSHGIRHLKPLTLRDIAREIEMHESTVSRVTANKYVATPRGVYQMKYFFTSAITSSIGQEALSAEAVRDRIRELIRNETLEDILSDDKIVEILCAENIDIARRTVAKYRDAMQIPSSVTRRRQKKAPALHAI